MGSKKRKNSEISIHIPRFTSDWITPSKTRNAMLNDYILDWLDLYGESKGFIPENKKDTYDPELDFGKYTMDQGKKFETYIIDELKKKFSLDFVEVIDIDNHKKAETTIGLMKKGTPIIYQGMIFNPKIKIYGMPDLLVRSDYINLLVPTRTVSDYQFGCNFGDGWHYRVIDIKFHTLHLKANFTTICNDDSIRAFKAQCYLYNRCLQHIQGYHPRKAYILGRGWNATHKSVDYCCNDPFNKLGIIDFSGDDFSICDDALLAAQWYLRVKTDGKNWNVYPTPSISELYPNMKVQSSKWKTAKYEIANKLEELTLLYNCGYYNRIYAHIQGILKISDPRLNARTLDISGQKNCDLVNGILEAYNKHHKDVSSGSALPTYNKKSVSLNFKKPVEGFFIDTESISSIYNIRDNTDSRIYMIGVGFFENSREVGTNTWNYRYFVADGLDEKSENEMFARFKAYLSDSTTIKLSGGTKIIWHYNSTDKNELYKLEERLNSSGSKWCDKYNFQDVYSKLKEGIFIPGSVNFSLKNISKGLGCNRYDDLTIRSGSDSIIYGIRYYEKKEQEKNYPMSSNCASADCTVFLNNVIKYNENDCIALSDVVRYITN